MNELEIAKGIQEGHLPSPQQCGNFWLFALRITGTGVAYREKGNQYTYRPPEAYLTDDFMARCAALPVIWEHPEQDLMQGSDYAERVIGSIMYAYRRDDDVWGIARIQDEAAAQVMQNEQLSTSPSIVFEHEGDIQVKDLEDNAVPLSIEGRPIHLDHVAICERGVWDKGGDVAGILTEGNTMDEEVQGAAAPEPTLGDIAKMLGGIVARLDKLEAAETAEAANLGTEMGDLNLGEQTIQAPDAVHDLDQNAMTGTDSNEPTADVAMDDACSASDEQGGDILMAADSAMKKRLEASEKANRELQAQIKAIQSHLTEPSSEARQLLSEIQVKADSVASALGEQPVIPMIGESPMSYWRRAVDRFKKHSQDYKSVDLSAVKDKTLMGIISERVFADAIAASKSPEMIGVGNLRQSISTDPVTGRRIISYHGDSKAWMSQFSYPSQAVVGFNKR